MMRVSSILALGAVLLAAPAFAASVEFSLLGTTDAIATRDITVGPQPAGFGCSFCITDNVSDIDLTTGLGSTVMLPPTGGTVNVFALADLVGVPSAGLMSTVFDVTTTSGPAGLTYSAFNWDTVYRDVPGRTALFLPGLPSPIPIERRISGPNTSAAGPWEQSWTGPFAASNGLAGSSLTDVGAGSSALDTNSSLHTFGIGQRGNDGSGGPTALGHFSVTVPGTPGTYTLEADDQSLLIYTQSPVFSTPPNPATVTVAGTLRDSAPLTIIVTPEPSTLLMLLPVAALLRRRR